MQNTVLQTNISTPYDYRLSAAPRKSYLEAVTAPKASDSKAENNTLTSQDIIDLSPAAKAAMAESKPAPNDYAQFMPVREGFSNVAISRAVVSPGEESTSAGKSLSEVAKIARQMMDAKYAAMEASGKPFDINSNGGIDANTLVGDLDRRTLYAIKTNQDGLFSKDEQMVADVVMFNQQSLALGLYSGPSDLAGKFYDRFGDNHAARFKEAVNWLDMLSADEKSSVSWAYSRASAQRSYESVSGKRDASLDSPLPLAQLIYEAMGTMGEGNFERAWSKGRVDSYADLLSEPWFKGYEQRLISFTNQVR